MEGEGEGENPPPPPSSPSTSTAEKPDGSPAPTAFDPSRMIGIIKRKALIKELAEAYHAECLAYCQELLELQKRWDEPYIDTKPREDSRKDALRPPKRAKKSR
ncbi:hypothetical protein MLD38_016681 [Melastoma candidum]|uniref:Uncharacterized protein n=1 Tax=Melastoma candidum TaxID=119954 RepID=A0ACB9QPD5_9MYRT|nr:hypothetical protein MLD38_016681 [Melastoma candidum]